jgi:hypothetical protein
MGEPTAKLTKPTALERIINAWPVIVTIVGVAITWYVQINMIEFRLNKAEQEISTLRQDFKENLLKINDSVRDLQLDVRTLVTLTKQANNGSQK